MIDGMPKISFVKSRKPIDVPAGANLMSALLAAGIPVGSSCGGEGVCTKCLVKIVQGTASLSPKNEREKTLRTQHSIPEEMRVSCQAQVLGDITVDTDYW